MFILVNDGYKKLKLVNLDNVNMFETCDTRGKGTLIAHTDGGYSYCDETVEQINKLIDEKSKQSV